MSRAELTAFRLATARRETPEALYSMGGVVLLLTVVHFVLAAAGAPTWSYGVEFSAGAVSIACAWLISAGHVAAPVVPWVAAGALGVLLAALLLQVTVTPDSVGLAYVLIVLVLSGLIIIDWLPFLVLMVPVVIGFGAVARATAVDEAMSWILVGAGVALVSAVLMRTKIRSINALAEATVLSERLAITDQLTGVLNRHGMDTMLPSVIARALRQEQNLHVTFVDVDGLKDANDRHGHQVGDVILRSVADAIRGSVRGEDLVTRWGGDEFLMVGSGDPPGADVLDARIEEGLRASSMDMRDWCRTVSVGVAVTGAKDVDVEALISAADTNMYVRRARARARQAPDTPIRR